MKLKRFPVIELGEKERNYWYSGLKENWNATDSFGLTTTTIGWKDKNYWRYVLNVKLGL